MADRDKAWLARWRGGLKPWWVDNIVERALPSVKTVSQVPNGAFTYRLKIKVPKTMSKNKGTKMLKDTGILWLIKDKTQSESSL